MRWWAAVFLGTCAAGPARIPAPAVPVTPVVAGGSIEGRVVRSISAPAFVYVTDVVALAPSTAETSVTIRDKQYGARAISVLAGTTLRIENGDPIWHNAFSITPGQAFDVGRFREGESRSVVLAKPGVVSIYCNMHPQEIFSVLVTPGPHVARVGADGRYRLDGVPPGRHTVAAWTPNSKITSVEVDVVVGETATPEPIRFPKRYSPYRAPRHVIACSGTGPTFPSPEDLDACR